MSDPSPNSTPDPPAPQTPHLAELLRLSARGNERAFTQLYDATAPRLYGLALRVVVNPAQAEEVTQEAYLKIWRTSSRFDPLRGSAMGWMLAILHGTAVDRVRSAQARSDRENRDHRLTPVTQSEDPTHQEVQASLDAARVRRSLAQLSRIQREAIELAYFGGFTHSEIARITGAPLGTTKTRIRDGLIRLRDLTQAE